MSKSEPQEPQAETEIFHDDQPPEADFATPLKVACEIRTYKGSQGEMIFGMFPLNGDAPRFYGEANVRAKPAGPFPEVSIPFRFAIVKAATPQQAVDMFDKYCQLHEPKAKQAAAKEWHLRYGQEAMRRQMMQGGPGPSANQLVDPMGNPVGPPIPNQHRKGIIGA